MSFLFTIGSFEYSKKSFEKGSKFVQKPFKWISNFLAKRNLNKLIPRAQHVHLLKGCVSFKSKVAAESLLFTCGVFSLKFIFFHCDIKKMSDDPLIFFKYE